MLRFVVEMQIFLKFPWEENALERFSLKCRRSDFMIAIFWKILIDSQICFERKKFKCSRRGPFQESGDGNGLYFEPADVRKNGFGLKKLELTLKQLE